MKRLKTGDIIEIYIEEVELYFYAKYIDRRKLGNNISYPFQFRISSTFSDNRIEIGELDFDNLLFSPWHLVGHSEMIRSNRWTVVGNIQVTNDDLSQHHYKMAWPPNLLAIPAAAKSWRVVKNIDNVNDGVIVKYEACSHLEDIGNHGALNLEFRIIIEYLKIKSRLSEINKSNWDKYYHILFEQFSAMPPFIFLQMNLKGRVNEL